MLHIVHILHMMHIWSFTESLLNIHEDVRAKPSSWVAVGWLPVIDEENSNRPTQGCESNAARNVRLYHQCWNRFLSLWPEQTEHALVVLYCDGKARLTRHYLGSMVKCR